MFFCPGIAPNRLDKKCSLFAKIIFTRLVVQGSTTREHLVNPVDLEHPVKLSGESWCDVDSEQGSENGDKMDKMNMINQMSFAENKSIAISTTATASSAGQKMQPIRENFFYATRRSGIDHQRASRQSC